MWVLAVGGGRFPLTQDFPLSAVAGLIINWTQDRCMGEKKYILIHVCGGLIEMGPQKWTKQAAFILFRRRKSTLVRR